VVVKASANTTFVVEPVHVVPHKRRKQLDDVQDTPLRTLVVAPGPFGVVWMAPGRRCGGDTCAQQYADIANATTPRLRATAFADRPTTRSVSLQVPGGMPTTALRPLPELRLCHLSLRPVA